jgi:hypothetical protein
MKHQQNVLMHVLHRPVETAVERRLKIDNYYAAKLS